jgi:hypothetical protein
LEGAIIRRPLCGENSRYGLFNFLLSTTVPAAFLVHHTIYQITYSYYLLSKSPMPSATGADWEKYGKNFVDDEIPEKKITPLTDE